MIREADFLMAEAIIIIAGLYQVGILRKPASYTYAYPGAGDYFAGWHRKEKDERDIPT